ncbi:hypothetical protein, partial [Clostridium perfringens]|uniref:hypothetical protein n=1 Tax=Clostridium perfringens TaxID=1502 RepID=UPI0039E914DE
ASGVCAHTTIPSRIFACLLKKASIGYGRPYPKIPNGMLVRFHLIPIKSLKQKTFFASGFFVASLDFILKELKQGHSFFASIVLLVLVQYLTGKIS